MVVVEVVVVVVVVVVIPETALKCLPHKHVFLRKTSWMVNCSQSMSCYYLIVTSVLSNYLKTSLVVPF